MSASDNDTMTEISITVNGIEENVPISATLSSLLKQFCKDEIHLIVELNGRCVYPEKYEATTISAGDKIEFINPNFGG